MDLLRETTRVGVDALLVDRLQVVRRGVLGLRGAWRFHDSVKHVGVHKGRVAGGEFASSLALVLGLPIVLKA